MRQSLLTFAVAVLSTFGSAGVMFAQAHSAPALNSCVKEFYDPGMYNYLTFKNNCSQSLNVVFVAKDGSGAGGSMDLRPGAQDSVGKIAGKAPKIGAFQLYICRSGYAPVDESGKVVAKPRANFQCQPKSQ